MTVSVFGYYDTFSSFLYSVVGANYLLLTGLLIVLAFILLLFEAGYAFRIVQKSLDSAEEPPKFNKFRIMFNHGINETILISIYFSILLIILYYILDYTLSPLPLIILFHVVDYVLSGWNLGMFSITNQITASIIVLLSIVVIGGPPSDKRTWKGGYDRIYSCRRVYCPLYHHVRLKIYCFYFTKTVHNQ